MTYTNDHDLRCECCGEMLVYTPQGFIGCPNCGHGDSTQKMFAKIVIEMRKLIDKVEVIK